MVVQLATIMLACMMRKPARLTANALLITTAMKATAELQQQQQQQGRLSPSCRQHDTRPHTQVLQLSTPRAVTVHSSMCTAVCLLVMSSTATACIQSACGTSRDLQCCNDSDYLSSSAAHLLPGVPLKKTSIGLMRLASAITLATNVYARNSRKNL